jgi:hypothetical protein
MDQNSRKSRSLVLAALLAAWGARLCAADDWLVGHAWKLDKNSAAQSTLAATPDGLSIDFKIAVTSAVHVVCSTPIPIPAGAKRVTFWMDPAVMGHAFPWKSQTASVHVTVRDARGAVHRYPCCVGSLNNRGWGCLATEDLALCPYRPAWEKSPPEPLVLLGLEIQPGPAAVKHIGLHGLGADANPRTLPTRPWEVLSLSDPEDRASWHSWTRNAVEYDAQEWNSTPYLTTDALVNRPGKYIVGLRLRDGWEGPIQREWTADVVLSPTGFQQEKRRSLLLGPPHPGTYFLEARIWDRDCTLLALKHFMVIVPTGIPCAAAPQSSGGFLALQTAAARRAFAQPETPRLSLQVKMPPLAGEKSIHVLLTDYEFVAVKDQTLAIGPSVSGNWTAPIEFPPQTQGACRAFVELRAAGKVIDRDSLIVGRLAGGGADAGSASAAARLPNGVGVSAMLVYAVPPAGLDVAARVGRGMDQAVLSGNRVVEIQLPWQDLEPLPGLYQFKLLDKILDLAEKKGLKVKVAPWFLGDHAPRWLLSHTACYEDGSSSFIGGSHFNPSAADPVVERAIVALWKAIARHCRHHPAVGGYLIVGPSLDLGYWHNGMLHETDYAPGVEISYQRFLKDVRGHSLPEVGTRYGRRFTSWQEIMPPKKNWDGELDLRPQWIDFCDYQQWQLHRWMEQIFQTIREEDPLHDMTQYQFVGYGPQEYYYPLFKKYRVEPTTGGTEGANYQRFMSVYHLWGLRSRGGETIQDVTRWNMYRSIFNMLAYGGEGGYYAVQWHNVFPEPWDREADGAKHLQEWSTPRACGGWLDRVKRINFAPDFAHGAKVLETLGHAEPMPLEAGSLSSFANCLYQSRCMLPYFVSGMAVNKAWMEKEHRLPLWVSEMTPVDLYRKVKLLVVDADIPAMSRATAASLTAYVNGGGCLATFAAAGKYTVEMGNPDFGFLTGLGFPVPLPLPQSPADATAQGASLFAHERLVFKDLWKVHAPSDTKVLARLPDRAPCVLRRRLGKGEIILFLGELDWDRSGHVLGALCRYRNIPRWCDASDSRIQVYTLHEGDTRYVLAYYSLDRRQNPSDEGRPVEAQVKIHHLASPVSAVAELIGSRSLGNFTLAQLENGLPLQFQPGELKVLKCSPAIDRKQP